MAGMHRQSIDFIGCQDLERLLFDRLARHAEFGNVRWR
jgi:hypothetical protein